MSIEKEQELSLEEQVERIRNKRKRYHDTSRVRAVLNTVFLLLAAVGLVAYFWDDQHHNLALATIGVGMLVKVAEFMIRFLL